MDAESLRNQNDFTEKLFLLKLLRLSQTPISETDLARTAYGQNTAHNLRKIRKHLKELHGKSIESPLGGFFGLTRQRRDSKSFEWLARHIEPKADAEALIERQLAYVTLERHLYLIFPASTAEMILQHLDESTLHYSDLDEAISSLDHPSVRPRFACENTDGKLYFLPTQSKNDSKEKQ